MVRMVAGWWTSTTASLFLAATILLLLLCSHPACAFIMTTPNHHNQRRSSSVPILLVRTSSMRLASSSSSSSSSSSDNSDGNPNHHEGGGENLVGQENNDYYDRNPFAEFYKLPPPEEVLRRQQANDPIAQAFNNVGEHFDDVFDVDQIHTTRRVPLAHHPALSSSSSSNSAIRDPILRSAESDVLLNLAMEWEHENKMEKKKQYENDDNDNEPKKHHAANGINEIPPSSPTTVLPIAEDETTTEHAAAVYADLAAEWSARNQQKENDAAALDPFPAVPPPKAAAAAPAVAAVPPTDPAQLAREWKAMNNQAHDDEKKKLAQPKRSTRQSLPTAAIPTLDQPAAPANLAREWKATNQPTDNGSVAGGAVLPATPFVPPTTPTQSASSVDYEQQLARAWTAMNRAHNRDAQASPSFPVPSQHAPAAGASQHFRLAREWTAMNRATDDDDKHAGRPPLAAAAAAPDTSFESKPPRTEQAVALQEQLSREWTRRNAAAPDEFKLLGDLPFVPPQQQQQVEPSSFASMETPLDDDSKKEYELRNSRLLKEESKDTNGRWGTAEVGRLRTGMGELAMPEMPEVDDDTETSEYILRNSRILQESSSSNDETVARWGSAEVDRVRTGMGELRVPEMPEAVVVVVVVNNDDDRNSEETTSDDSAYDLRSSRLLNEEGSSSDQKGRRWGSAEVDRVRTGKGELTVPEMPEATADSDNEYDLRNSRLLKEESNSSDQKGRWGGAEVDRVRTGMGELASPETEAGSSQSSGGKTISDALKQPNESPKFISRRESRNEPPIPEKEAAGGVIEAPWWTTPGSQSEPMSAVSGAATIEETPQQKQESVKQKEVASNKAASAGGGVTLQASQNMPPSSDEWWKTSPADMMDRVHQGPDYRGSSSAWQRLDQRPSLQELLSSGSDIPRQDFEVPPIWWEKTPIHLHNDCESLASSLNEGAFADDMLLVAGVALHQAHPQWDIQQARVSKVGPAGVVLLTWIVDESRESNCVNLYVPFPAQNKFSFASIRKSVVDLIADAHVQTEKVQEQQQ